LKICYNCKQEKLKTEYHKHPQKTDGLHPSCKECRKPVGKKHYEKNSDKIKLRCNNYYYNNKEKVIRQSSVYKKYKMETDMFFVLQRRLRCRLSDALRVTYWKKNTHFSEYIGCNREELIEHIRSQFTDGMSWENRSEWHIDHIIPLSSAKTEKKLYSLCHYTNLQPMWAIDNIKKGTTVSSPL